MSESKPRPDRNPGEFRDSFRSKEVTSPRQWQRQVLRTFERLVGTPRATIKEIRQQDEEVTNGISRRRYEITLCSRWAPRSPWPILPVYEVLPRHQSLNGCTVLAFHGHGLEGPFGGLYSYVDELAREGYRVIMPVLYGTMERNRQAIDNIVLLCAHWSKQADAMGTSLIGARLLDAITAFRFACRILGGDTSRLACVGLSLGGEMALYLGLVEPRIQAVVSAGFLSSFRYLLLESGGCHCYSIRGWPRYFDMADLAGAVAPRPLQIQRGDDDPCFDAADVRDAFAHVQSIYGAFGAEEMVEYRTFQGAHELDTGLAVAWLRRHLRHD